MYRFYIKAASKSLKLVVCGWRNCCISYWELVT